MTWRQLGRYLEERGLALSVRAEPCGFSAAIHDSEHSWHGRSPDLSDAILEAMERRGLADLDAAREAGL